MATHELRSNHSRRAALITGAGSGIGRATAILLAARGYRLALLGRRIEALEATAAQLTSADPLCLSADVRDPHAWDVVEARIKNWNPRLEALVNCAGLAHFEPTDGHSIDHWREVIEVNLTGPFLAVRALLPLLRQGSNPSIVNVASTLGITGLRHAGAYCASKGGLVNWTRAAALDLAPLGVRINAVLPGVVESEMLDIPRPDAAAAGRRERLAQRHPLGRLAKPQEIAEVIVTLLEPQTSFVTGACWTVDGGLSAGSEE